MLLREDVASELQWDLTTIFSSDEMWVNEFKEIEELSYQNNTYKEIVTKNAESLFKTLQFADHLFERADKLFIYANCKLDQDTTNPYYQEMYSKVKGIATTLGVDWSFIIPEILKLDEKTLEEYVMQYKPLKIYEHSFKEINATRSHTRSADNERILAQLSEVISSSQTIFFNLNYADLNFSKIKEGTIQLSHSNYMSLLESNDRQLRKEAFVTLYQTYNQFKNTIASALIGTVKAHNAQAKIHNYTSARQAALSKNFISESVYDQLISNVHDSLPELHRYMELRKKMLQVEKLHMYDLFVPIVEEVNLQSTYEQAQQILLNSFAPLGKNYQQLVKKGFNERWVDVVENKGKRSDAYSSGSYGTNPFILINWQDTLSNVYTLAHEFGHSIHSYYTRVTQPYHYGKYAVFIAEVASITNEELVSHHLIKTAKNKNQQIYFLAKWLDEFRDTIFRQTMLAEFEHIIHQLDAAGEALTAEILTTIYLDLNKQYFGDSVTIDKEIGLEWARIPHFHYNYYVYQYATGKAAAIALSQQLLLNKDAKDRYINQFLKAGSSEFPLNILKAVDIDMQSPMPVITACKVFKEKLNELEQLLDGFSN